MNKSKEWVEFYDDYDPPKQHKMHKSEIIHFLHDTSDNSYSIQGKSCYYVGMTKETWDRVYQEVQGISDDMPPLVNPDSFTHPDGTILYWKGSDDGSHARTPFGNYNLWCDSLGVMFRRDGKPYSIDYKNKRLCWCPFETCICASAVYEHDYKTITFWDPYTGKHIQTIENVHLDFDLLKP